MTSRESDFGNGDGERDMNAFADTGWLPDPSGRHEGRDLVAGQPTDLIRDGGIEILDSVGKQQLDQAVVVGVS